MKKTVTVSAIALVLLVLAMVCSIPIGSSSLSFTELRGIFDPAFPAPSPLRMSILTELRIPRILMACLLYTSDAADE